MVYQPSPSYVLTSSLNLPCPSPPSTGFPALSSMQPHSGRSATGFIEYTARPSRSRNQRGSAILPIGTERTSPPRMKPTGPFLQEGEDSVTGQRKSEFQTTLRNGNQNQSDQSHDGCRELRDQDIWQQLQSWNEQRQNTPPEPQQYQPIAPTRLHKPSYAEEISRYLKDQQYEAALRHAEDLAAGRAHPSGEGGFQPPPGPSDANNTTVFVGGLHHNITEPELSKFFQPFGSICYVKIPPGKGCGFVQFVQKLSAEFALERMQGFMLNGCKIRLSWGRTADKIPKSQDVEKNTLATLPGLNSMSPDYVEKLGFAMELINNESLFREIMTIHESLVKREAGRPLDGGGLASRGMDCCDPHDVSSCGPLPGRSANKEYQLRPDQPRMPSQADVYQGFTPFSPPLSPRFPASRRSSDFEESEQGTGLASDDQKILVGNGQSPTRVPTGRSNPRFPSSFSSITSLDGVASLPVVPRVSSIPAPAPASVTSLTKSLGKVQRI